ncbi:hypothetical protein L0222_22565 [bacterium]|nr:hypothetical protein [bacterium]MCI0604008.1 hypothetical protein [bacterium]
MKKLFSFAAVLLTCVNCFGLSEEEAGLLKMHEQDRRAHFETDVELLLESSPDLFITVARGKIDRVTRQQEREMFTQYFQNATYYEWNNLEPPIVRVSKDGTMGWIISRIKVRRVQKDSTGKEQEQQFVYAGIMTYEKVQGKWIRHANVSTFE